MVKFTFLYLLLFVNVLLAVDTLHPTYSLMSSGDAQDIVYKNGKLYSATSEGTVDIFDTKEKKLIKKVKLPDIKDFMGDDVPAKVYSVDIYIKIAFLLYPKV